jgi:hypothetical protein
MTANSPPTRPPTADELLADPIVQQALQQAWLDSIPSDASQRHEEGGWIYMDLGTGQLDIRRAPAGQRARLDLSNPLLLPNAIIVGTFHTHPNPTAEGWHPGPSSTDQAAATHSGVPWLIRSDSGDFQTGPDSRRGGLTGGPGYPP